MQMLLRKISIHDHSLFKHAFLYPYLGKSSHSAQKRCLNQEREKSENRFHHCSRRCWVKISQPRRQQSHRCLKPDRQRMALGEVACGNQLSSPTPSQVLFQKESGSRNENPTFCIVVIGQVSFQMKRVLKARIRLCIVVIVSRSSIITYRIYFNYIYKTYLIYISESCNAFSHPFLASW